MPEVNTQNKLVALKLRSLNWLDRTLVLRKLPDDSRRLAKKHLTELSAYSRLECKAILKKLRDENQVTSISESNIARQPEISAHLKALLNGDVKVTEAVRALAQGMEQK